MEQVLHPTTATGNPLPIFFTLSVVLIIQVLFKIHIYMIDYYVLRKSIYVKLEYQFM